MRRFIGAILSMALWMSSAFSDVISYLRFEDGAGLATDETGLMDGELINFDPDYEGWSTDVFGSIIPQTGQPNAGSILFGGGSEFIDLSNFNDLSLGTRFTIECFMKPNYPIISTVFGLAPSSKLYLQLSDNLGTPYFNPQFMDELPYALATSLQFGVWQHVALVKDPGEYSIFVNGILVVNEGLPSSTDGPYYFPGSGMTGDRTIGGQYGTFSGYLDEFRISDQALTPDQFLNAVPEPGTFALVGLGGLAFLFSKPWKKRGKYFQGLEK